MVGRGVTLLRTEVQSVFGRVSSSQMHPLSRIITCLAGSHVAKAGLCFALERFESVLEVLVLFALSFWLLPRSLVTSHFPD